MILVYIDSLKKEGIFSLHYIDTEEGIEEGFTGFLWLKLLPGIVFRNAIRYEQSSYFILFCLSIYLNYLCEFSFLVCSKLNCV